MRWAVRSRANAASSFSASFDGLARELLDDRLAPRTERVTAEAAAESLYAGDADPEQFAGVAIEHVEPASVKTRATSASLPTRGRGCPARRRRNAQGSRARAPAPAPPPADRSR